MNILDNDELTSLSITLSSETVVVIRGLLLNSKIGVKNKEELESFDLQVLHEVMKDMAAYLTSTSPRSDVPIAIRADAYRAALALQKSAPHIFEKQLTTVPQWINTVAEYEKLLKKQEGAKLSKEGRLDYEISVSSSSIPKASEAFLKELRDHEKERAQIKLHVDKKSYQLFLKNQLSRFTKDANRILVASQYLFNEKPQGPTFLTVKPPKMP